MMLMSSRRAIPALAVIGALGVATWLATRPAADAAVPPAATPAAVLPPIVPPPSAPPAAAAAVEKAPPEAVVLFPALPGKGSVKFPDGSVHRALNGVTDALEAPWPAGHPYAPVVAQLHYNDADWYQHADGTYTTTLVRTDTVSGREVQGAYCYTPSPSKSETKL